jgi:predicted metal-binding membrane protein
MAGMPGTMGLGLAVFVPVWTLMMAAMMLPSVAPTASLYAKTVQTNRMPRIAGLVAGYLASGRRLACLPTGWPGSLADRTHPSAAHVLAVAVFAACGVYQLSRLKDRCLAHCRSPLALLLHYGSYRGRFRDLRAGAHQADTAWAAAGA